MRSREADIEKQQCREPDPAELEVPLRRRVSRHVRLDLTRRGVLDSDRPWGSGASIYIRSRSHSRPASRTQSAFDLAYRSGRSSGRDTPTASGTFSPRPSMRSVSTLRLHALLEDLEQEHYDTFGVEELRDGFFDASFHAPRKRRMSSGATSLSSGQLSPIFPPEDATFSKQSDLKFWNFWKTQWDDIKWFVDRSLTTRRGIVVLKSALSFWIAYILCLIPPVKLWLGRYAYFAPIAAILNHAGRSVGAQIEGTVECILGPLFGAAAGAVAMELSHSSRFAYSGKGGVISAVMAVFLFLQAWVRCYWLRLHQATISSIMTFLFVCLELTEEDRVGRWRTQKIADFLLPWAIGIAVCLVVNILLFPSAGCRHVAFSIHKAIEGAKMCMVLPREPSATLRRHMTLQLINLSEAVRDMRMEISVFTLRPKEAEQLRNALQAVIRDLMNIDPATALFDPEAVIDPLIRATTRDSTDSGSETEGIEMRMDDMESTSSGVNLVKQHMSGPARGLIDRMTDILCICDVELMRLTRHEPFLDADAETAGHVEEYIARLEETQRAFDEADRALFAEPHFPKTLSMHPEIVELFLFIHPLRKASTTFMNLAKMVSELKSRPNAGKWMLLWPRYPLKRAFLRANKTVRHDRGGINVGRYFHMKKALRKRIEEFAAKRFVPTPKTDETGAYIEETIQAKPAGIAQTAEPGSFRYRSWRFFHRLQGFESRFAFKVTVLILLLAIPAWLKASVKWWNANEIWWVTLVAWLMMHPRVGGNFRDLLTRVMSAVIGAVWGALAYFSRDGNPYVLAAFAAIFAYPALFRYTSSAHPRSGLITSLAFTIVSLSVFNGSPHQTPLHVAWTRSAAIIVGAVSAVVVNWIFWPFVARHELRKSVSMILLHLGIYYRIIVSKFIYHDENTSPTVEDIEYSEVTEAYLREGIIRLLSIIEMTEHEIRIRGPFNDKPYSQLILCLERFFERLVQVRQSSLYFQSYISKDTEEINRRLISVRRDAVASVLMNTYLLAGALRTAQPVPKYIPSASAARKRLLDKMEELEMDQVWESDTATIATHERMGETDGGEAQVRPWASVYQYAFSAALTDIVEILEEIQALTKEILGEMVLDIGEHRRL